MAEQEFVSRSVRLVLVDHDELVLEGLTIRLDAVSNLEVVGHAATASLAAKKIRWLKPDVVVLDAALAGATGSDLFRRIGTISPQTRCVIHAVFPITDSADRYAGATVVLKELAGDKLIAAINRAATGL